MPRVFYGDQLFPTRSSVAGGTPVSISGLGLQSKTIVQTANASLPVLTASATQLLIDTPPALDGLYDVQLSDAKTGGSSTMSGVLAIGGGPSDTLKLISGAGTATPVGGRVNTPFAVAVLAPDGFTPVSGASVQFSSSPAAAFSVCGGASSCAVLSDQSGMVSTGTTVLALGVTTLTAKLAPLSYPMPQQVQATVLGISSALDLIFANPVPLDRPGRDHKYSVDLARAVERKSPKRRDPELSDHARFRDVVFRNRPNECNWLC